MSAAAYVAAEAIRESARANLREGDEWRIETDARSVKGVMLIGIATPTLSCTIAVDPTEWDGLKTAEMLGFKKVAPPSAMERAKAARP